MSNDIKGKRVAILATDGFEEIELTSPREALEKAGAKCVIVSPGPEAIQGFKHHDKAGKFKVDLPLSKASASDFDAVLLPGGVLNGDALRVDQKAQQFVQEIDRAGKPVMVICHGGWILISAGITRDRNVTSWPTLADDFRNSGASWVDQDVVVDRNWISSRKPDDLPAFNTSIVKALTDLQPGKVAAAGSRAEHSTRP